MDIHPVSKLGCQKGSSNKSIAMQMVRQMVRQPFRICKEKQNSLLLLNARRETLYNYYCNAVSIFFVEESGNVLNGTSFLSNNWFHE